jgi:hypothetical protein
MTHGLFSIYVPQWRNDAAAGRGRALKIRRKPLIIRALGLHFALERALGMEINSRRRKTQIESSCHIEAVRKLAVPSGR